MADYIVTGPDGAKYRMSADNDDAIHLAVGQMFGGAAPPAPSGSIASQFGGAPQTEPPAGDVETPAPSLGQRFMANAGEAFGNTSTGEVINYNRSGQRDQQEADDLFRAITEARQAQSPVGLDVLAATPGKIPLLHQPTPSPWTGVSMADMERRWNELNAAATDKRIGYDATRAADRAETEAMPSFTQAPSMGDKILQGAAAMVGQLAGGLPAPENLVGGGAGGAGREILEAGVKSALKRFGKEAAESAATNAGAAAVATPAVNAGQQSRGEAEDLTAGEFAQSVALGGAIGAAFHVPAAIARPIIEHIAARRGVKPDQVDPNTVGPGEVRGALADPQITALAKANGIESPTDPRLAQLEQKVAARKVEDSFRTPDMPKESLQAQDAEMLRRQNERQGVQDDTVHPVATNVVPRQPDQTPIMVDREGGAFRATSGNLEGRKKAEQLQTPIALPAPGREVFTDEEIARQRAAAEGGNQPTVETPPRLYGQEGRAPQTSEGVEGQRQAGEAFTLAQRQKDRAAADVRDTQTAGRPEGANQQTVHLDEGHPVEILDRRMVPNAKGDMVEVARVRRYDPRTGQPEHDAVAYDVPVRQLKTGQYAQEPRMAQDFEARAGTPEGERMGLPRQTYRTTEQDAHPTESGRYSRPEQPEGPHPGPRFSRTEEAVRDFEARQARGEASGPAGDQYRDQKTSTKAAAPGRGGRFVVDENGYVASDKGGPIKFGTQQQAAKWIINEGHKKSPDQVFEIANHPGDKGGFTVRERGRTETPPSGGETGGPKTGPQTPPPKPEAPKGPPPQLNGPRAEATPVEAPKAEPPAAAAEAPAKSFDDMVREEKGKLWSTSSKEGGMGRRHDDLAANQRMADGWARMNAMKADVGEPTMRRVIDEAGASQDHIEEIARYYDRQDGQTPATAFERAVDRWVTDAERQAAHEEGAFDAEDRAHNATEIDKHEIPGTRPETVNHDAIPFEDRPTERAGGEAAPEGHAGGERPGGQTERGSEAPGNDRPGFAYEPEREGWQQGVIPGAERRAADRAAERPSDKKLKGSNEPPPKGGLFDEDARNQRDIFDPRNTLHSNPMFDTRMWKWFGSKVLGFNDNWKRSMSRLAMDMAKAKDANATVKSNVFAKNFFTWALNSADAETRALGRVYDNSPTIKSVADMFQAPADVGRGGAVGQTYHEGVAERTGHNLNALAKIMEPFVSKPETVDQIVRLVQNPGSIRQGTKIHDAAAALRKMLDAEHAYLKEAGVDVGHVKGYFPRVVDLVKSAANPEAFKAAAVRAYKASGLGAKEAKEAADHWFERIALGSVNVRPDGTDFLMHGGSPSANFAKGRELSKAADAIMAPFYHRDPMEALSIYFQRTARRAEWARRMGDDMAHWKDMKADLVKEGNAAAIPELVRLIASVAGTSPPQVPSAARSALGVLRTWGVMRLLPRATVTNLTDMLMPSIRAGSPARALNDVFNTVRALTGGLEDQREFAEDLGLISHSGDSGVLASRFNVLNPTDRIHETLVNRFFRATGMEQLNGATRTMGVKSGEAFIRRLALDVASGKRATLSSNLLTELGVSDVKGFASWVKGAEKPGRNIDEGGHSDTYRTAVIRFVNQASLLPTKSTKPTWANHPLGSLIYMLNSYNQAFMRDVYGRAKNQVISAASPSNGLSAMERAKVLTPIAMLPALMAAQLAVAPIRQAVFGSAGKKAQNPDEEGAQLVLQALSRSLSASYDPLLQLYSGAKYHRSAGDAISGPAVGSITQAFDTLMALAPKTSFGGSNSDRTNTAERNATRALYEMFVAPAIIAGASLLPPQVGFAVAQIPGLSPVRDEVIDSVAGPQQTAGGGRPSRPSRK